MGENFEFSRYDPARKSIPAETRRLVQKRIDGDAHKSIESAEILWATLSGEQANRLANSVITA